MRSSLYLVAATLLGCSSSVMAPASASTAPASTQAASTAGSDRAPTSHSETGLAENQHLGADLEQPTLRYSAAILETLPAAPWSSAPLSSASAPEGLVETWAQASNRTWCAPISIDEVGGARARAVALGEGWSVEFDQPGAAGVRANGTECRRCGRSAFGIAGTAMSVEQLLDPETDAPPAPEFADGGSTHAQSEGSVASATIAIGGQGCVYQVWTFLGEEHLAELVSNLRFVEVADSSFALAQGE